MMTVVIESDYVMYFSAFC